MQSPLDAKCGFVTDRSQNTSNIRNIGYGRCLSFKVTLRVERNEFRCTIENYQSDRSAITIVCLMLQSALSQCPAGQSIQDGHERSVFDFEHLVKREDAPNSAQLCSY
ncbi:hypothetical protein DAPPUDRAFT_270401, partial [Daphnia pulex]